MPCRALTPIRWGSLLLLIASHAGAEPADSVTRDAARSLGLSGVEAYQAGDYGTASNRLEKAYSLINVPSLGLWSARALAKRNLLVEAANRYIEVVGLQVPEGDAAVQHQAQLDAQSELDQLRPQIPRLNVRIEAADAAEATLSIDGQNLPGSSAGKPRLVNPGHHRVQAQLAAEQRTAEVDVALGKEATVVLNFARTTPAGNQPALVAADSPAAPSGSARRTLGWIGVGVGGAGLALGATAGVLALGKRSSLENSGACTNTVCAPEKDLDVKSLDTYRTVSTVGFIAGGALAATGIVLLLTAPSNEHALSATASADRILLTGRF